MGKTSKFVCLAVVCLMVCFGTTTARADSLTLNFDGTTSFSGTALSGTFTAQFTGNSNGTVTLVLTSNLGSGQNIDPGDGLYFNFNPLLDVTQLSFALSANTGLPSPATVNLGEDAFKPDGDGQMDIEFTYGPGSKPFQNGQSQTYIITSGLGSIDAADFDFLSTCGNGCGTGPHLAAIHVQNTGANAAGSDWNGPNTPTNPVPEPASFALFGTGLAAVAALMRRGKRS